MQLWAWANAREEFFSSFLVFMIKLFKCKGSFILVNIRLYFSPHPGPYNRIPVLGVDARAPSLKNSLDSYELLVVWPCLEPLV